MKSATIIIKTKEAKVKAKQKTIQVTDVDVSAALPWWCR